MRQQAMTAVDLIGMSEPGSRFTEVRNCLSGRLRPDCVQNPLVERLE
jgi:hypothetical protein